MSANLTPLIKDHPGEGSAARGVLPRLPGGWKQQRGASFGGRYDQSEAQFGFIITQPPLSGNKRFCRHSSFCS